jgi:hypothetical protein
MSHKSGENDLEKSLRVVDKEDEVDEDNVEVSIESLHLKMEELMELIKSATMVASKEVLEEQPAKECTIPMAKVKALKKRKEEVNGLLVDLLENSKESQYQRDEYEAVLVRQSFFGGARTPASTSGEQQSFFKNLIVVPKDMPKYGKGEYKDVEDFVLGLEKKLNAYELDYDANWECLYPLDIQHFESKWVEANLCCDLAVSRSTNISTLACCIDSLNNCNSFLFSSSLCISFFWFITTMSNFAIVCSAVRPSWLASSKNNVCLVSPALSALSA